MKVITESGFKFKSVTEPPILKSTEVFSEPNTQTGTVFSTVDHYFGFDRSLRPDDCRYGLTRVSNAAGTADQGPN